MKHFLAGIVIAAIALGGCETPRDSQADEQEIRNIIVSPMAVGKSRA